MLSRSPRLAVDVERFQMDHTHNLSLFLATPFLFFFPSLFFYFIFFFFSYFLGLLFTACVCVVGSLDKCDSTATWRFCCVRYHDGALIVIIVIAWEKAKHLWGIWRSLFIFFKPSFGLLE